MLIAEDKTLIKKIQLGNKKAFDKLFYKYHHILFNFALNKCKDQVIAEEAIQNLFINIWNNAEQINTDENILNYLFVSTRNQIIDCIRKENTRKKYELDYVHEGDSTVDADKDLIIKSLIESGIQQLPPKAREIFRLCKQEGLSHDEVAEYLKISKKTIENQLTSAYKKLKVYLGTYKNILEN